MRAASLEARGVRIAVLSLTRDRLEYTQHCFATLHAQDVAFDHLILDQGSTDGSQEWLRSSCPYTLLFESPTNLGISPGMNTLVEAALELQPDVIVKVDNDCELIHPDTLRTVCEVVMDTGWLLSPRIRGLRNPPGVIQEWALAGEAVHETAVIGGIFLAAPAALYRDGYRFSTLNPSWGGDDVGVCQTVRARGGHCGYVARLAAWHYETTDGQHARFPHYFARVAAEGKPA